MGLQREADISHFTPTLTTHIRYGSDSVEITFPLTINPKAVMRGGQSNIFEAQISIGGEAKDLVILQPRIVDDTLRTSKGLLHYKRDARSDIQYPDFYYGIDDLIRSGALMARVEAEAVWKGQPSPVPHVYGVVRDKDGVLGLAVEKIEGVLLLDVIRTGIPLPKETYLSNMMQLTKALSLFEACGIVHKDLTADNIMIDTKGRVKILDLGISLLTGTAPAGEKDRYEHLGKPGYTAPESYLGNDIMKQDLGTDLYALGVLFWEMVTGNSYPDFLEQKLGTLDNMQNHVADRNASLLRLRYLGEEMNRADVPFEVWMIIQRLVAYDIEKRGTLKDLEQDLISAMA